jgi:hypothetical protein
MCFGEHIGSCLAPFRPNTVAAMPNVYLDLRNMVVSFSRCGRVRDLRFPILSGRRARRVNLPFPLAF